MDFIVQSVVIGLTENAPLVLAAIGFALLYRLTGLINVAYAETITLGAYFGMWFNTTFGLDFYAVLVPDRRSFAGLLSVATYLVIFRPAKRRNVGGLELIIISFGLSILLRHGLQFVFGYPERFYDVPPPETIMHHGRRRHVLPPARPRERRGAAPGCSTCSSSERARPPDPGPGQRREPGTGQRDPATRRDPDDLVHRRRRRRAGRRLLRRRGVRLAAARLAAVPPASHGGPRGWELGLGGVIAVGVGTGVALAAMALQFDQVLYAQLVLIVAFIVVLKVRGTRRHRDGEGVVRCFDWFDAFLITGLFEVVMVIGLALLLHLQLGLTRIANFGVVGFWGLGMYAFGVLYVEGRLAVRGPLAVPGLRRCRDAHRRGSPASSSDG